MLNFLSIKNEYRSIYIVILLSLIIYLPILFIMIPSNSNNLNDLGRYFFSASAQTLGALIAIVLTALYYNITNIKPPSMHNKKEIPTNEPIKRLIINDIFLKTSIFLGLLAILLSLFFITPTSLDKFTNYDYLFMIIGIWLILTLATISIYCMYAFISNRASIYFHTNSLLIYLSQKAKLNSFTKTNYLELLILNSFYYTEFSYYHKLDIFNNDSDSNLNVYVKTAYYNLINDFNKYSLNHFKFNESIIETITYLYEISRTIDNYKVLIIFLNQIIINAENKPKIISTIKERYINDKESYINSDQLTKIFEPQSIKDLKLLISIFNGLPHEDYCNSEKHTILKIINHLEEIYFSDNDPRKIAIKELKQMILWK